MKAYAIKDPNDDIRIKSIGLYEEHVKSDFIPNERWEDLERKGYRCVPVEITEIKPNEK